MAEGSCWPRTDPPVADSANPALSMLCHISLGGEMNKVFPVALAVFSAAAVNALAGGEITVVSFGRANQAAVEAAYIKPFGKTAGVTVNDVTYDGQTDELKAMVKTGKLKWDVIQVESRTLDLGCKEGLFEKLDHGRLGDKVDAVSGANTDCGSGIFAWSQAFVYNADKVAGTPTSWADFWDVKKFPGKRGLRRSAKYTLEFALLADGVAPADVYTVLATKQGVDRAFRKLDQIRPDTIWWEAAPQPAVFLAGDRTVMSSAYTFWVGAEQKRGKNLKIVWNGSLYDFDSWAIPRGTPRIADAYKFIAFSHKPENQKVFSQEIAYGPANQKALPMLDPKLAGTLPTAEANLKGAMAINIAFWVRNGAQLEKRFADWAPPLNRQTVEEHEHDPSDHDHHDGHGTTPHVH
jgi:putative spermidine/putrescine transport system substrate-binding protein